MSDKIKVELENRSYDIIVGAGAIGNLRDFLHHRKYSKIFVITDENVAKFHLETLEKNLEGRLFSVVQVASGEQSKSFAVLEKTCEEILAQGLDRKSLIIAFGGGVIGDLAGFVASILLRGIDFIQIPTTLLAAVDSSVGGKTAVNSAHGKNLIGSFYQPQLVITDLDFLKTLPQRQLQSGYAEVVKYGLIYDRNFFDFLKNHQKGFEDEFLQQIITRSCQIKAEIVGRDEKESGERALLNFGHTFGHVFETEVNYSSEILHGEAVAIGMMMAAKMSFNFGLINQDELLLVEKYLSQSGFVIDPKKIRQKWNKENLTKHLFKDKKTENNNLTFILLDKIGKGVIKKAVPLTEFDRVLKEFVESL